MRKYSYALSAYAPTETFAVSAISTRADKAQGRDIQLIGRPVSVDHNEGNKSADDERFAAYMMSMTSSTAA